MSRIISTVTIPTNNFQKPRLVAQLKTALGVSQLSLGYVTSNETIIVNVPDSPIITVAQLDAALSTYNMNQLTFGELQQLVKAGAKTSMGSIPDWASWTETEALAWFDANVNDLASVQIVLRVMVRLLVALRNDTWPDLESS